MLSSKETTLSWVTTVFLCLQTCVHNQLKSLLENTPQQLVMGLVKAYQKLAEYHQLMDQLPYYLWVLCELLFSTQMLLSVFN
jgi:hypothetical protein